MRLFLIEERYLQDYDGFYRTPETVGEESLPPVRVRKARDFFLQGHHTHDVHIKPLLMH